MKPRLFRSARYRGFSFQQTLRRMVFWTGAVFVAAAAILFAKGANAAFANFRGVVALHPWLAILLCPLGLVIALGLTRRVFAGAQGSGIPQTIAVIQEPGIAEESAVLSMRVAVGKILITMLGLACGASVGREGPSVQVGAAIMHNLGKVLHLPQRHLRRALVLAGGAAGVAAAFNTPLAGVVFAIEELSRSFDERTSGRVLTAVIIAGIASMAVLGNYTYFGHTNAALDLNNGWLAVILCGVAGGLLGGLFARTMIAFSHGLPGRCGAWTRANPMAFAALCGLVLAGLGLLSGGGTYGTGYDETRALLSGGATSSSWWLLKMLATMVSYASGIPGGIFSPSLAVGAGIGSALAGWMPLVPPGAAIILCMAAYFTGAVQAPITAVVIVMEMTDDQAMTIPLMAAALIALSVSRQICPKPFYKALAEGFLSTPKATATAPH